MENMQTQGVSPQEAPTQKKKGKGLLWIIIIIILAAAAYFGWTQMAAGEAVAMVGGEAITQAQLEQRMDLNKKTILAQDPSIDFESEQNQNVLLAQTLEQLINERILLQAAQARGISVSTSEVDDQFDIIAARFETEEAFNEELKNSGLTVNVFRNNIKNELIIREYIDALGTEGNVAVTQAEVESAYATVAAQDSSIPALTEVYSQVEELLKAQKLEGLLANNLAALRNDADISVIIDVPSVSPGASAVPAIETTPPTDATEMTVEDDADAEDTTTDDAEMVDEESEE